jgi:hypothetical protein
MFSRRDFPDYKTEAASIRERHGPPAPTPDEIAAREAETRRIEGEVMAAYDDGVSVSAINKSFQHVGLYRIRQVIARANFSRRFADDASQAAFLQNLRNERCDECLARYLSGPWRNWAIGKRLTFPEPDQCSHTSP